MSRQSLSSAYSSLWICLSLRLAEEYKEQKWSAMAGLEQELQQMELQYGREFGDTEEEEVEEDQAETGTESCLNCRNLYAYNTKKKARQS